MATVLNVTEILKRSDGTEVKISGDSKFYAQNNYANLILLDIEDGGSLEACALINFTQQTRQSFTSHNFFMKPVGIVTRVVNEEVITAYQYAIQVPKLVLQNNTKNVIETELTTTISSGSNYKGYFSTLVSLNTSIPPTEMLKNDLSIAYVVELEKFMQVDYNSLTMVYEWVEVDYVDMFLTQKQYSLSSIYIQPGYSSPQGIAPISVSNTQVIMNILNDLEVLYNSLNIDFTAHINNLNNPHEVKAVQVPFNNVGTQLVSTNTEGAIKEVNANERNTNSVVNSILDGTATLSEIRIGLEPNVAILKYIHTNGNNYQVVQIQYPDGRLEEINETIPVNFRNETGLTLNSGRLLMSDGTTQGGNPPRGLLFDPTSPNAYKLLGVTTIDGTAPNAKSKVTKLGIVHDVLIADLFVSGTTYEEGQFLWGVANGRLSNKAPNKPALQVIVGMIINLTGTKVDILINPIIFEKLADQSDVTITAIQNKDILRYDSVTQLWKNSNGLTVAETDIANMKSGVQVVKKAEQDQLGNVINTTYETKAVVSGINTRVINLENANMVKSVAYQPLTHIITFTFFDNTTQSLDLPLESTIIGSSYDNITKDITFTLQNGETLVVPLDDLVEGLANETWVMENFIPKTALKSNFSTVPLNTNVPSEKLVKDELDKKELLENKSNDFSVVNDTKYPTTKAVSERLLNLPIAELNNHTLREVFESGNLVLNDDFNNGTTGWVAQTSVTDFIVSNGIASFRPNTNGLDSSITYEIINVVNNNTYYSVSRIKTTSLYIGFSLAGVGGTLSKITNEYNLVSSKFTWPSPTGAYSVSIRNTLDNNTDLQYVDYVKLYNLTSLGISSLTVAQMDYWFNVYQALLVSDTNAIFSLFAPKQQEEWITPTLLNGWVTAVGRDVKYMKDTLGFVHIKGRITSGTIGSIAFTLPPGYRPTEIMRFPIVSNDLFGIVYINSVSGDLIVQLGNNTYVDLYSISFRAEV